MAENTPSRTQRPGPRPGGHGPGGPMMMSVEKAKDFKGTFRKLTSYLAPYKWKILVVGIFAVISTVFMILGPKILGTATDELTNGIRGILQGDPDAMNYNAIGVILLKGLGLYAISAVFMYFQGYIIAGVSAKVSYDLRDSIEKKINLLPLNFFHTTTQGDVLSRVTNDVDTVSTNLNNSITQAISSVASFIGVLVMMFTINYKLTMIALVTIPVSIVGVILIVKRSQKYFKGQQSFLGDVNGHIEEMYGGHLVVKAFNGEQRSVEEFDRRNEKLYDSTWKAQFYSSLIQPLMTLVSNMGYVLVCVIGATMAPAVITLGDLQAFIQYMRNLNQPVTQLANISNQIQQTVAAAERVFEFLDQKEEPEEQTKLQVLTDDTVPATDTAIHIQGNVAFDHVKFSYNGEDVIIHDFSAQVKAGQKIAIVGPTGAGKTTLVKLLMRFYDLDAGAIFVDGHDMTDFSRHDIRKEFGMVLQDAWLHNGTIKQNIRYGKLDATDAEVIAAAKAAQVDQFVRVLPEGYDTMLNEEATNISQGQKQLITIARAILADARIMILDEATSSVDTRTEVLIQRAMDNLMQGRTSFIIAHRLSTIRNADLILCLDNGDIVEQGTHDELMAKGGFYHNLYLSQFENISA